ncbi:MAG: serine hydrolase, partial [Fulvivirga sp.]|uniref:serine hydrolase domain-containing protein n=1 Tax=Fulvivirga sp. TaxID=1931237 RepID=UPI0032EBCCF4
MNKILRNVILLALAGILIYGLNYAYRAIPIISGYGAKNLCSCVFVSGRDVEDVKANELKVNPLLAAGNFEVNWADSSATGDVFGLVKKKAIYRKGLGCTLLSELSEEEVRSQKYSLRTINQPADTLYWPYGTQLQDTVFSNVDYTKLNQALENAFKENDPEVKVNTRGVVVVYKGTIIGEKYAENFNEQTPQMGWSMTKSVTATLIGMLAKDGKLDINQPAPVALWKDDRSKITVDQLLRMSSGLEWEEVYSGPSSAVSMLYEKADMGGYAGSKPLQYQPDEVWYYSSGTSNILAKIVREKVG